MELSPESGVQSTSVSRQLFVPQVPAGYVAPALPFLPRREPFVPQPQLQNSDNLVEQMRLMMQGMLQGTKSRLIKC